MISNIAAELHPRVTKSACTRICYLFAKLGRPLREIVFHCAVIINRNSQPSQSVITAVMTKLLVHDCCYPGNEYKIKCDTNKVLTGIYATNEGSSFLFHWVSNFSFHQTFYCQAMQAKLSENTLIRHEAGSHFILNFTIK